MAEASKARDEAEAGTPGEDFSRSPTHVDCKVALGQRKAIEGFELLQARFRVIAGFLVIVAMQVVARIRPLYKIHVVWAMIPVGKITFASVQNMTH